MPVQRRSAAAKRKIFQRFVSTLRLSDEDIAVIIEFPEAARAANDAIKAVLVSPGSVLNRMKRDTRRGMGSSVAGKPVDAEGLQQLLSVLDITYDDMESVFTSSESRKAARRAIRAVIAPPEVALLRARLKGYYNHRLYTGSPSDFYRAALNLDANKLLGHERITEAERRIIRFRYGFVTSQPESLDATAEHFSLTRDELRELLDHALFSLDRKWMQECGADI